MRTYHVYILASRSRALYVAMTNDLARRVALHRAGAIHTTSRYRIRRLVYAEFTTDVRAAIRREKQLKGWRRSRKIVLVTSVNPLWDDLMPE